MYANKEQEKDRTKFLDKSTGVEMEQAEEPLPLLEWFADKYKEFGAALEFVTNRSQEGAQFVKGFGGIGGLLRYKVDFTNLASVDDEDSDDEDFSDANTTVSTLDSQAEHLNLDTEDDDDDDIDSLRSSRTCVANEGEEERGLAADDLDSGWVRIDAKELDKEARWAPVSSTRARPRPSHSRLRVSSWLKALCSRRGRRASLRR